MTAGPRPPVEDAPSVAAPTTFPVGELVVRLVVIAVLWLTLVVAFVAIGHAITSSSAMRAFDAHVTHFVASNRSTALVDAMKAVTWLGSWVTVVVTAIVLVVLRVLRRLTTTFVVLAVALWGGNQAATTIVKSRVRRSRPPAAVQVVTAHGWSFPSGHSSTATVIAITLVGLAVVLTTRRAVRLLSVVVAVVLAASVASSRVVLGVHWTTDVVMGAALALLWGLVLVGVVPTWVRARALHPPGGVP